MISITINTEKSIPLVIPMGRLDMTNSTEFEKALKPLMEKEKYLIIDLSQCNYLSSAGIRILLMSEKILLSKGGGLFLSGLLPEVYQVIEMAGLHNVFRFFKNTESALGEIERVIQNTNKSIEWSDGVNTYYFHSIENNRKATCLWKNQGIAGYNELEISIGTGSPAETPEEDILSVGVFITGNCCAGFIPNDTEQSPDFRITNNPSNAGIYVREALSFGKKPTGLVRLSKPSSISYGKLADAIFPLKQQLSSGHPDLMSLVIADCNPASPSVSICVVVDQIMNDELNHSEVREIHNLIKADEPGNKIWGAKFVLGEVPDVKSDISLSEFLNKTLTIENIINVEIIIPDDIAINPTVWLFIADGITDASSKRLSIEKEGDFIFEPQKVFLTRRLYTDSARLIIKQIHGGYSAQTYQVTSFDHENRKMRPTVLKIANKSIITRESERCQKFALPYIFNNSAKVLGTEFFGDTGALTYNFVGIGGEHSQLKWLTHYYQNWSAEQLEPLFDKVFLQILNPWYGQPKRDKIYPYKDHDPSYTFFSDLCEMGEKLFSISPQEKHFLVKETSQKLVNPYWFLKYEFERLRNTGMDYYTSICHGDLNMQNILLDDDMNVYLIDFSETKPRSIISDFARLEAIFMIDNAPLENEDDLEEYIKFVSRFYNTIQLGELPENTYKGAHKEVVNRNVFLCHKMRKYAFNSVGGDPDPVPYCLALLEWILPIVCYNSAPINNKRISMIVSGLICEKLIDIG